MTKPAIRRVLLWLPAPFGFDVANIQMNTDLSIARQRLQATMYKLPYQVGVLMLAWSKDRFKYQNWIDTYTKAWKPRKEKTKWGKTKRNKGRALLVDTGRLRRSIRILQTTANSVTIGSDTPYAAAHNEGVRMVVIQQVGAHTRKRMKTKKMVSGEINVSAHTRRISQHIPRRRFMGQSKHLNIQISSLISAEINKIFNP